MNITHTAAWLQVIIIIATVLITGGLPIILASHLTMAGARMFAEDSVDARLTRLERVLRQQIEREQEQMALLGREAARMQALTHASGTT